MEHAGDSTGSAGVGVRIEMAEEGPFVSWEGQLWDEPAANIHQQWDKGAGTRSGEQVCWEQRLQDAVCCLLPVQGDQAVCQPTAYLRDIFGGLVTGDSM